jgi:hypothetical protein
VILGDVMDSQSLPYIVVVEAEYESEWHHEPTRFPSYYEAIRFATGIAKSLEGKSNAPTISIRGPAHTGSFTVEALLFLGWAKGWFDEAP